MPSEVLSAAFRATLAAVAALWLASIQPAAAQSFLDPLLGADAPARSRPGAGYVRMQPHGPSPPPMSLFSPYQSYLPYERPAPDYGTYRTLCVRMCDGFYFPISYATGSAGFPRDAEKCAAACGGDARLFYHRIPGGDIEAMVDLTGRAYGSYPTAFKYRKTLVEGCQCRPQPWSEAERARHRTYAAMPPPAEDADAAPPAEKRSAASGMAGERPEELETPEPIDRAALEGPTSLAPPTLPGYASPQPAAVARPRRLSRHLQAEPWNWLPGNAASGQSDGSLALPSGR
jgi:hypothetical protein